MNPRAQWRRAARIRQLCFFLATHVLRFASFAAAVLPFSLRGARESRPYLTVVMAAPLRFAEPPVPSPILAPKPANPAASVPAVVPAHAEKADVIPPAATTAATPGSESALEAANPHDAKPPETPDKSGQPAPAILPDETRSKVHAEDFLPYFQFPGAGPNPNDVIVAPTPPEPGKLPPSSASYRQQ